MTEQPADRTAGLAIGDLRILLDRAPCGIIVVDGATGSIEYANTTMLELLPLRDNDISGAPVVSLFTAVTADTVAALVESARTADGAPLDAGAALDIAHPAGGLPVSIMARAHTFSEGRTVVQLSMHTAAKTVLRESALIEDRDRATAARHDAEAAQIKSETALESSETARTLAEAERTHTQVLAATLQRTLLPAALSAPPGTDVAAYYHPASLDEVGGDFYDLFPLSESTWGFFLGDVSGKGAGAAAVTSLTRYTLRAAAVFDRDPIAVLHNLNSVLRQEFHGDDPRFCTVLYGVLTIGKDQVEIDLASGGHPPALVLRAAGTAEYTDTVGGQLVGALPAPTFVSTHLTLCPGDVLVLYTDGLTESVVGPGRARYNDDGALERFAAAKAPTTAPQIIDDLRTLLNSFGDGLQDDVALLALGTPPHPKHS